MVKVRSTWETKSKLQSTLRCPFCQTEITVPYLEKRGLVKGYFWEQRIPCHKCRKEMLVEIGEKK